MTSGARFDTIVDIFTSSVRSFPARPLFGVKKDGVWRWTTYAEFGDLVDRARRSLAALGVGKGDKVAMIAGNSVEWAVAAYATYGRGAAFVPTFEQLPAKEWQYILQDSRAKVLFVATTAIYERVKSFLEELPDLKHIVVLEDRFVPKDGEPSSSFAGLLVRGGGDREGGTLVVPASTDIADILYTSGTTSTPKGVILTHGNVTFVVNAIADVLSSGVLTVDPSDRSLAFLPWAHALGQTCELHTFISLGLSVALAESVEKITDNLAEVQPTILFGVPRLFSKLYSAVNEQLWSRPRLIRRMVKEALRACALVRAGKPVSLGGRIIRWLTDRLVFSKVRARFGRRFRFAISGGAAISHEVLEFIDSLGITVYEGYGLTETSPLVSVNLPGHCRVGSVGRPLPGVRVDIDPTAGNREFNGKKEGEIIVSGPNVMVGYHNRPNEDAAVFTTARGLRTGDMGYVDADGFLFITGRIKEQYKLENGKYVVPTPLEDDLKASPYITNVMLYGGDRPFNVALVVVNVGSVTTWAALHGLSLQGDALLAHEKVMGLIRREIDRLSENFKPFEAVKEFALIDQDFTVVNGMLTPSMKVRRSKVLEVYGPVFEALYPAKPGPSMRPRRTAPPGGSRPPSS
jgi:long-chain acyl-CoA synthetase